MTKAINKVINTFKPISLNEMDAVSLMKRTDTKFVIPISQLTSILQDLTNSYKILTINDNKMMTYSSMYFDTQNNSFYNDHHNGKSNRTKIRIRNYVESNLFFLEVKQKNGKGITNKSRIPLDGFESKLSETPKEFINEVTSENYDLKTSMLNTFRRITLVSIENKERVTIDLDISFSLKDTSKSWEDMVVIELKQERFNRNSSIVKSLNTYGYKPFSISKYCIGMMALHSDIKYNKFKEKIRTINKILAA